MPKNTTQCPHPGLEPRLLAPESSALLNHEATIPNWNIMWSSLLLRNCKEVCKDSRQDSGHNNFSYARYAEKLFTQIYIDLYGDAMLVPIRMGPNMAARNQQETSVTEFCYKSVNLSLEEL